MDDKFNLLQIATGAFQVTGGEPLFGPVPDENAHDFTR